MFRDSSLQVPLKPGLQQVSIALKPDPLFLREEMAAAEQSLQTKLYLNAVEKSRTVLGLQPRDPEALSIMAEAFYSMHNFEKAAIYADEATANGGSVRFFIYHHHVLRPSHPAVLTIGPTSLQLENDSGTRCPLGHFIAPFTMLVESKVIYNNQGGILLHLRVRDPNKKRKVLTVNLGDPDARIIFGPRTLNSNTSLAPGPYARPALDVINDLLNRLRASAETRTVNQAR
ncbi:MAG: tetratricopeptide repeat protein [Candidatus Micrarchaeaceae archaeon]